MSGRGDFGFARATQHDEADIRALVGGLVMPGTVSVRFEREPDYFLGTTIQGQPCDVLIARHQPDGALAAVMVRAERRVFINGEQGRVAYIGQIRIAPRYQGRWLMQRAVLEIAQLHDPAVPYLGVIASDNAVALGTIAGRRPPGSPRLSHIARLASPAWLLHCRMKRTGPSIPVEWGGPAQLDEIVAFLRSEGPRRQFFPVVERTDFTDEQTLRGLRLEDLCMVRRDGHIVGLLGAWDQSAFKQEIVAAYAPRLRRLKPGYDLFAHALGGQPLPSPGQSIRVSFGCLRCVADDDPDVLDALLRGTRERARRQGQAFLMLGFDARDPQLRSLRRSLHLTYRSDVFLGSHAGDDPGAELDGRPVHIEIGTL